MRILIILLLLLPPLWGEECSIAHFTLDQAERIALQNNKDICKLCQLYQSARMGKFVSISKWLPEINLLSDGYKTQVRQSNTGSYSAYISQFFLSQRLFSTDAYYDVKIAGLVVQNLKLLLEGVMIDVLFNVRTAFYQVVLDYQNITTAKTNVEILSNLAWRMEKDYKRGTSILLNVNQSKVAVANATSAYYQAIKQLEIDLDYLVTVLGYNPGEVKLEFDALEIPIGQIPELASKVEWLTNVFAEKEKQGLVYKPDFPKTEEKYMKHLFSEGEICAWEKLAFQYRPDLKVRCTEWKIANEAVNKEKGTYLPEVKLAFNYGGYPTETEFNPSSTFFNQKFQWALGFNFSWLLFDGLGRDFRVRQARYESKAKCCEYKKGIQLTFQDVRDQIFSISESVASFTTAEGNVALAEQTLDLANKQLEIGYLTIFDYQIVVDGLIQALYIRDQARYDLIKGYFGLKHASGYDLQNCLLGI